MACGPSSMRNCVSDMGLLLLLACVHTAAPRGTSSAHDDEAAAPRAGYSPPPRHHHGIKIVPAISRPSRTGTNIGGTSHSCSLNFWMVDILTALFCGGSTGLSVTDSGQGWTVITAADALSCTMSREIAKANAVSTVSLYRPRTARKPCYPMPEHPYEP